MSAECGKCGSDITYPPGSWPLGHCEPCDLRERLDALDDAIADALDFLPYRGSQAWQRVDPRAAGDILIAALETLRLRDRCPSCGGPAGDNWFDRSICACGLMHTRCAGCGAALDACEAASAEAPSGPEPTQKDSP